MQYVGVKMFGLVVMLLGEWALGGRIG